MKKLCTILAASLTLTAAGQGSGPVTQTTPYTRGLLRATDAATARGTLGVLATNNWPITGAVLQVPILNGATINNLKRGGTLYCDTNGSDATFISGDPGHPCQSPGFAISNCPNGGMIIFTPGQIFNQSGAMTWSNSIKIRADGVTFRGNPATPQTGFALGLNGGLEMWGGYLDNLSLFDGTNLINASVQVLGNCSNAYWFHGTKFSGMTDVFHGTGTLQDSSDLWLDHCTIIPNGDTTKMLCQSTNTTIRIDGGGLIQTNAMAYAYNGIGLSPQGGHYIIRDFKFTQYDVTNGSASTPPVLLYNLSNAVTTIADLWNCVPDYRGSNTLTLFYLSGNCILNVHGTSITPNSGTITKTANDTISFQTIDAAPEVLNFSYFPLLFTNATGVYAYDGQAQDTGIYLTNILTGTLTNTTSTRYFTNINGNWCLNQGANSRFSNTIAGKLAPTKGTDWSNAPAAGTFQLFTIPFYQFSPNVVTPPAAVLAGNLSAQVSGGSFQPTNNALTLLANNNGAALTNSSMSANTNALASLTDAATITGNSLAHLYRAGQFAMTAAGLTQTNVTFSSPLPSADYALTFSLRSNTINGSAEITATAQTAGGFTFTNNSGTLPNPFRADWTAIMRQ